MGKGTDTALPAHVQDALDKEYPKTWIFQEDGKQVSGEFVKLDHGFTRQYGECPIVVLNVNGQERSIWLMHKSLRSKMSQVRPSVGETIAIKQGDKRTSKDGMEYYDYRVVNVSREQDNPDNGNDWDSIALTDDDMPF